MNTSASGHGKHIHDGLIGTTKGKVSKGFKTQGAIPIGPKDSIARKTVSYLKAEYESEVKEDLNHYKYRWQLIEVSEADIIVANSPTKRILTKGPNEGVQSHCSLHSDINGNVKMKIHSCHCVKCASSNYTECDNMEYVGNWYDCKQMRDHPIYEKLQSKQNPRKRQRVSNNSNHTNRYNGS